LQVQLGLNALTNGWVIEAGFAADPKGATNLTVVPEPQLHLIFLPIIE